MNKSITGIALMTAVFLHAETKVLAFAGSTQKNSFNKKLVLEAADLARQDGAQVTVVNLEDYEAPFYSADLERKEKMPAKAKKLRDLMIQNQVIIIASPEYNASVSAALKNAIDWASRSESGSPSREAFKGKTFVIISASPGKGGGVRGLKHLRAILEDAGGTVVDQQVTVPDAFNAFDDQGHLKNSETRAQLKQLIDQVVKSA